MSRQWVTIIIRVIFTNARATPTKFQTFNEVALERTMLSYCTQAAYELAKKEKAAIIVWY